MSRLIAAVLKFFLIAFWVFDTRILSKWRRFSGSKFELKNEYFVFNLPAQYLSNDFLLYFTQNKKKSYYWPIITGG